MEGDRPYDLNSSDCKISGFVSLVSPGKMIRKILFLVLAASIHITFCQNVSEIMLPNQLSMGAGTSAYQVEGAWNEDGRGQSIWDTFVHDYPERILDRSTGDVACDTYHKTKEDVALLKNMGFHFYRFSISWSRVLPKGFENEVNPLGIAYYNNLIDELLANGIEPVVTIHHFDLPQPLQDLGGWTNPNIIEWFTNFARILFQHFGDRVKSWITINEPKQLCRFSYAKGLIAPGLISEGLGEYLCIHYVTLAHASVYHLYSRRFRKNQKGKIGLTIDGSWAEPIVKREREAANRKIAFDIDMFANPIFGQLGGYPDFINKFIGYKSKLEGYTESRLPKLSPEEISYIKGTADFFGINYYYTSLVKSGPSTLLNNKDMNVEDLPEPDPNRNANEYIKLAAIGFRKLLRYVKTKYGNPEIWILENGFQTEGYDLDDQSRISYLKNNIRSVVDAINQDKVNVRRYTVWSIMDNFEWHRGYTVRFGLFHINFTDPSRERVPKASARFFKTLLATKTLSTE